MTRGFSLVILKASLVLVSLLLLSRTARAQDLILWVAQDGSGDYTSISEAIAAAPSLTPNENEWAEVRVVQGIYTAPAGSPLITWLGNNLFLRGGWDRVNGRRSPSEFPTILDGQGLPRPECISISNPNRYNGELEFSGFTVRGCNGGGARIENVRYIRLSDLVFEDNRTLSSLISITTLDTQTVRLQRVRFERNRISGTCGIRGGALFVSRAYLAIEDSAFVGNILECGQGGALGIDRSGGRISGTVFKGNRASEGGGAVYISGGPFVDGPGSINKLKIGQSLFWQNRVTGADGQGGAIKLGDSATVVFASNILDNFASQGRAIYYQATDQNSSFQLSSSIVRNGGDELRLAGPAPVVRYNNIQGGFSGGEENIDSDPLFVDAAGGDFHLSSGSPCINRGEMMYDLQASDFYGGWRTVGPWDIGMDEFGPLEYPPCEEISSLPSSSSSSSSEGSSSSQPSSSPPGCRWIDISKEKGDILLGPGKLKDLALRALRKLANSRTADRALYKRLLLSAKRAGSKMDQAIKGSLVELAELPDRILDCPDTIECVSVDNSALIERHLWALNKLRAVFKRTLNRSTRLLMSIEQARRLTGPKLRVFMEVYRAVVAKARLLPASMSKCADQAFMFDGQSRPVYWVDPNGHGNFKTIQCAIDRVPSGSEIRIVQGTYKVPYRNVMLTWRYKNLALIGGFSAVNGEYNPLRYPSVLDGENLYRKYCVIIDNVNQDSSISGLTVTGCKAGVVSITDSEIDIKDDTFVQNETWGSVLTMRRVNTRIVKSLFNNNLNYIVCGSGSGGALTISWSRDFTISDSVFDSNSTSGGGGAVHLYIAAGLIDRSAFLRNIARHNGGALNLYDNYSAPYPEWALPVVVRNSLFAGNEAQRGGAMSVHMARVSLNNLTIVNNTASEGRAILSDPFPANFFLIRNVIMRNGGNEIFWKREPKRPAVVYSNVQGGFAGVGNIDQNTLFVDAAGGDYRLRADSPEINAGDPSYTPAVGETDFFGSARVRGGRVDMGMHEAR